jgi:hypothetical protein
MTEIAKAYEALKDPQRRAAYDALLSRSASNTSRSAGESPPVHETESFAPGPQAAAVVDTQGRHAIGIAIGAIAGQVCSLVLFVLIFRPVLAVLGVLVAFYYDAFAFIVSLGVGIATGYIAWAAGLMGAERFYYGEDYTYATRQAVLIRASVQNALLNADMILYVFLFLSLLRFVFLDGQPNALSAQLGSAAGALLAHRSLVLRWA